MVHLFLIQSKHQELHCLARVKNGVYTLESINGHPAKTFPSLLVARANHRLASQYNNNTSQQYSQRADAHPHDIPIVDHELSLDCDFSLDCDEECA